MTESTILDGVLQREGGLREAVRRPDGSVDPLTYRGITVQTLGIARRLGRPATRAELLAMTEEEARGIYRALFIEGPGFIPERVPDEALRLQVIDFGVNSGPARAVRYLQRVIRVPVTGHLDDITSGWLHTHRGFLWLVHDAFAAARARMVIGAVRGGTIRLADERGLLHRALAFVATTPEGR